MANKTHISKTYRDYLQTALARSLSSSAVNCIVAKFDYAVAGGQSVQKTFARLHEDYANGFTDVACSSIESELGKLNQQHGGVNCDPVTRLRAFLDRHRANLSHCECDIVDGAGKVKTIGGKAVADTVKNPSFIQKRNIVAHEAVGHYNGRAVKLGLEVIS